MAKKISSTPTTIQPCTKRKTTRLPSSMAHQKAQPTWDTRLTMLINSLLVLRKTHLQRRRRESYHLEGYWCVIKLQPCRWRLRNRKRSELFLFYVTFSILTFEPPHDKTNKMTCAPSEDSDQPGHARMPSRNRKRSELFLFYVTFSILTFEPPHDKTNKMTCAPSEGMRGCPGWSERTCHFVGFVMRRLICVYRLTHIINKHYSVRSENSLASTYSNYSDMYAEETFFSHSNILACAMTFEPRHDKTNKVTVRPASAQADQSLRCALSG